MTLKKIALSAAAGSAAVSAFAGIQIDCDRLTHIYHVGENAVFTVKTAKPKKIAIELSCDNEAILHKMTLTSPATFRFTLPHPGFLRVKVRAAGEKMKEAAVAFDPDQIRPALPEPEDFDAFWDNLRAKLKKVPVNFKMTEHKELGDKDYSFYDIQCDGINNTKTYGYLRLPKGKGPFPLLVYVEGAGKGQELESFQEHCRNVSKFCKGKVAAITIGVHAYKPAENNKEHSKQHDAYMKKLGCQSYWLEGLDGKDLSKTFFARAILGTSRLCDSVCGLPQIDKGHIAYLGASQGGGFGVYLTACCPQIRAAFCGVPAFGDCGGFLFGSHPTQSCIKELRKLYEPMRYFDAVNFARRIKVPVLMSAGFIDGCCWPSSIYAIYNQLQGPKFFYNKTVNGHGDAPLGYEAATWFFVARYMELPY